MAVIHDLLTSPWGKLGFPTGKVHLPSFGSAGHAVQRESRVLAVRRASEDASAIIADVLRQIDDRLYEEPTTGQLVLKLVQHGRQRVLRLEST